MKSWRFVLTALLAGILVASANATERFVVMSNDVDGAADGYTSWYYAATNIQLAINACGNNDIVTVSNGTYEAKVSKGGTTYGTLISLANKAGLTVRSANGRDYTILDGMYPAYTGAVIGVAKTATDILLDGFTVARGHDGPLAGNNNQGGGFWGEGTHTVTVQNCTFELNEATYGSGLRGNVNGAGLMFISNCVFRGNSGSSSMFSIQSGEGYVTDCAVSNNYSGNYLIGGPFHLERCQVISNTTAISLCPNILSVRGCTFTSNKWGNNYGFLNVSNIEDSVFIMPVASAVTGGGSGLIGYSSAGTAPTNVIRNCVIAGFQSASLAPVYVASGGLTAGKALRIENCTIARNKTQSGQSIHNGGICIASANTGDVVIVNSIVCTNYGYWTTHSDEYKANILNHSDPTVTVTISNSCVPTLSGSGNTGGDAQFVDVGTDHGVDWSGGDLSLQDTSPCKDGGQELDWHSGALDVAHNPRVSGAAVDMGAYEFELSPPSGTMILISR